MFPLAPNSSLDFICVTAVYLVAFYNLFRMNNDKRGTNYVFFVIVILSYSLFYRPIEGDFWHYYEIYQMGSGVEYRHMEDYYYWLIDIIPNNYLLWRVAVWLPAAIFIVMSFRVADVPSKITTVFFLIYGLSAFYYTRNALALSALYLAIALFCQREKYNKRNVILFAAAGLVLASLFLHRSMPMYIAIALIAVLLPFNRNYIIGALIAFPFLYGAVLLISYNFVNIAAIWLEDGTSMHYIEGTDNTYLNWKGVVDLVIRYGPVIFFYFIAFFCPIPKDQKNFKMYKSFLLFSFFVTYLSFLFFGQGTVAIQGRLYSSMLIPFSITVSLYFKHFMGNNKCRGFIILTMLYLVWSLFISMLQSL